MLIIETGALCVRMKPYKHLAQPSAQARSFKKSEIILLTRHKPRKCIQVTDNYKQACPLGRESWRILTFAGIGTVALVTKQKGPHHIGAALTYFSEAQFG
jgi:hypothetical protein